MKKIKIVFMAVMIFTFLGNLTFAEYDIEGYKQKLSKNTNIDSVEKVDNTDKRIIISGVVIKGVRVHRMDTNLEKQTSEVTILKQDIVNAFMTKNKDIKEIEITFNEDKIVTKGSVMLLGMLMDVYLEGMFYLTAKGEIVYDIKKATVNNFIAVPEGIVSDFRKRINPVFKLDEVGIPLYLTKIVLGKDRIVFR